jgi:serine/threonine protein kinase
MSHESTHLTCPQCHAPLPADAPQGLCPACLMAVAGLPTDQDTLPLTEADLPELADIAAAFPDLEILEKIGQGGMGVVFKARQPKLDRLVALKVLPKALAATPGFPERFTREGRVLARLSHPSIVTVHDFGESGGYCFLIMEYVDGVNLRQAMKAGRFTPEQALKVVPDICAALQAAHEQGVLHRDIKPENLLLDTKGRIKIADFGIAKLLDDRGADLLLTQSGARLGTAPYMAPEQIEQPSSVDHRADIYSLGVVLYEMLTGELPLGRFAAPSEKSAVSGSIDEIVFRALEKERGRRQQSAGEFKTQIEGATASPALRPVKVSEREKRLMLAILTLVVPCTVVFWVCMRWRQMLAEHSRFHLLEVPAAISLIGSVMLLSAVPLWLRLVPRNRLYGLRLPSTMVSDERWYETNAHAGKKLFEWSISVIIAGIVGFYQLPRHQDDYPWAALAFTFAALGAVLVSCWWWLRHHPVGEPVKKESRLAKACGKIVIAVIVALFIKSFIITPYRIPQGSEPGVTKGSHWIASRMDSGFDNGDLIVYEHDSDHTWIARVVKREPDGLLLKRGGSPDTFFVKWDKVIGKMMFSHFTPDVLIKEPLVMPRRASTSLPEGTSKAPDTRPVLHFSRLKLNEADWRWPVYAPDGSAVENAISQPLIWDAAHTEQEGQGADDCWWQLWFQHPDFDRRSMVHVSITHLDGSEIAGRDSSFAGPSIETPHALACVVISPGKKNNMPKAVRMVLRYSIGPLDEWQQSKIHV